MKYNKTRRRRRHHNPFVNRRRRQHRLNAFHRRRRARANPFLSYRRRRRMMSYLPRFVRRHYRRNPAGLNVMGLQLPALDSVLFVGVGFIAPPIVSGMLMGFVPDAYKTNTAVIWVVKGASVVLPSLLVRQFVSRRAGNLMLLGGVLSFGLDLIRTFAPGVIPGLGYQPLLGAFFDRPSLRPAYGPPRAPQLPPLVAAAPTRLDPQHRF